MATIDGPQGPTGHGMRTRQVLRYGRMQQSQREVRQRDHEPGEQPGLEGVVVPAFRDQPPTPVRSSSTTFNPTAKTMPSASFSTCASSNAVRRVAARWCPSWERASRAERRR
jgi:hypothetical protein